MESPVPPALVDTRADTVPPCFLSSGHQAWNCREAPAGGISQLHSAAGAAKPKPLDTQSCFQWFQLHVLCLVFGLFSLSILLFLLNFFTSLSLHIYAIKYSSFPSSRTFLSISFLSVLPVSSWLLPKKCSILELSHYFSTWGLSCPFYLWAFNGRGCVKSLDIGAHHNRSSFLSGLHPISC